MVLSLKFFSVYSPWLMKALLGAVALALPGCGRQEVVNGTAVSPSLAGPGIPAAPALGPKSYSLSPQEGAVLFGEFYSTLNTSFYDLLKNSRWGGTGAQRITIIYSLITADSRDITPP